LIILLEKSQLTDRYLFSYKTSLQAPLWVGQKLEGSKVAYFPHPAVSAAFIQKNLFVHQFDEVSHATI
jgi:hypothetical protein